MDKDQLNGPDGLPVYLTLKQFRDRVFPIGERTVWKLIAAGKFPRPSARIGTKTAVWKTEELLAWIEAQKRRELSHRPANVYERKRKKEKREKEVLTEGTI